MATPAASSVYKDPLHLTTGDQSLNQLVPQVFSEVAEIKQGDLSIAEFYAKLRSGWEDNRSLDPLPDCDYGALATCTCNILKKIVERENVHHILDFLMRLEKIYDTIRDHILALDPIPSINHVYAKLHQAEVQLNISAAAVVNSDGMALAAASTGLPKNVWRRDNKKTKFDTSNDQGAAPGKQPYYCTRCEKSGHTLEYCWVHKREQAKRAAFNQAQKQSAGYTAGKKFARNVEETPSDPDTPLDSPATTSPVIDASFVQAVAKELFKLQSQNFTDTAGSSQFSGTLLAASAHINNSCIIDRNWINDSGASDHMTYSLSNFKTIRQLIKPLSITLPDGLFKHVKFIGSVQITDGLTLHNVLYLPDFKHNLISLGKLLHNVRLCAKFSPDGCVIQDTITEEILCSGLKQGGIYHLSNIPKNKCTFSIPSCESITPNATFTVVRLMHARLGHSALSSMKHVVPQASSLMNDKGFHCDTCLMAKHHKSPFPTSTSITNAPFELIHVDLWGPYRVLALNGASYFLTVVDDFSKTTWTMLLKHKDLVSQTIDHFLAYVRNQFNTTVKTLRSDNGTEIVQRDCNHLFSEHGIVHQTSIPGNPQQNGRVERKHRHLLEVARALKIQSSLPSKFWGDLILAATHIINLLPTAVLKLKTPHECLFGKPPDYSHLRVVGCLCYAAHHDGDKFADRAIKCIFLGYPMGKKGYRLYSLDQHKVIYSRDVVFREHLFPYSPEYTNNTHNINHDNTQVFSQIVEEDNPPTDNSNTTNTTNTESPFVHPHEIPNTNNTINNNIDNITNTIFLPNTETVSTISSVDAQTRKSTRTRFFSSKLQEFDCRGIPQSLAHSTVGSTEAPHSACTALLNLDG
ncbi:uncharacterized protein LOC141618491 [Silene latifolia]|uniref:uncharacterized protein LOC141618491 n=1 Tax=Silene latifolia TaxID=37657 RepID=UPI003D77A272